MFDVHLMLVHPLPYIAPFRKAGADWITFHIESQDDPGKVIDAIVESGAKPGLALRPGTPIEELYPYGERLHSVTVMTVEPGYGGQKLMPEPLKKIRELKQRFPHILVEVDGGVNLETAPPMPGGRCGRAGGRHGGVWGRTSRGGHGPAPRGAGITPGKHTTGKLFP